LAVCCCIVEAEDESGESIAISSSSVNNMSSSVDEKFSSPSSVRVSDRGGVDHDAVLFGSRVVTRKTVHLVTHVTFAAHASATCRPMRLWPFAVQLCQNAADRGVRTRASSTQTTVTDREVLSRVVRRSTRRVVALGCASPLPCDFVETAFVIRAIASSSRARRAKTNE